jgi:hypothetical protein
MGKGLLSEHGHRLELSWHGNQKSKRWLGENVAKLNQKRAPVGGSSFVFFIVTDSGQGFAGHLVDRSSGRPAVLFRAGPVAAASAAPIGCRSEDSVRCLVLAVYFFRLPWYVSFLVALPGVTLIRVQFDLLSCLGVPPTTLLYRDRTWGTGSSQTTQGILRIASFGPRLYGGCLFGGRGIIRTPRLLSLFREVLFERARHRASPGYFALTSPM